MSYKPRFSDDAVQKVAAGRGVLQPGETLPQALHRAAAALGRIDADFGPAGEFAADLDSALVAGRIALSSQLLTSAGRSPAVAACTVLPVRGTTDDARLQHAMAAVTAASRAGMGCGLDLSDFDDPAAAAVQINTAICTVNADLVAAGRRPPALMLSCSGDHDRIGSFIDVKRDANFTAWVANISVRVSNDEWQWRRLLPALAAAAWRNGEPGVLFQASADADNPTPGIELVSTAPCAEVFLSPGERCVFVSVNLAAHVSDDGRFDWDVFRRSVGLAVRAGDAAVELAADGADPVVAARRRVGVGVTGFHTALIMMGVPYVASARLAAEISETLTFAAHRASVDLATSRGKFPLFEQSRWRDVQWLQRKQSRRVGAVDPADWGRLERDILEGGIRNAAVVAYPPTGVVSTLLGVSRSYEPHYTLVGRTGVASTATVELAPEVASVLRGRPGGSRLIAAVLDPASGHQLPGAVPDDVLACARQIPPAAHMAVHTAFSAMADEAGAKTVNLPATASVGDVAALLEQARRSGLKGLTVFRDGCLAGQEAAA